MIKEYESCVYMRTKKILCLKVFGFIKSKAKSKAKDY